MCCCKLLEFFYYVKSFLSKEFVHHFVAAGESLGFLKLKFSLDAAAEG